MPLLFKNIYYTDENFEIQTGSVEVEGKYISRVYDNAPENYAGTVIDGAGKILIPGLVNTHTHVPMTLLRGYGEGLALQEWLNDKIFPFEGRMTDEDAYWGALVGIADMLSCGVTSFTDMYDHTQFVARAVKETGIKANLGRGIVEFGGGDLYSSPRHREAVELIENWQGACGGRIICEASLHAEYTSNETVVRQMARFAKNSSLGIHLHLSETHREQDDCVLSRGVTPARYFEDCGIFENRTTAAHGVWLTDEDMDILASRAVTVAHCPASNLKLGSGIAKVPDMLKRGVAVSLGTDSASSNNNMNLLGDLRLAAMIHPGVTRDPLCITAKDVLRMATVVGAKAQGRTDCGLIKEGYRADLAVLNMKNPHMMPVHDVLTDIVYSAQQSDVETTIVDGEMVYHNGVFTMFDADEAIEKACQSAKRIASELNIR